MDKHEYRLKTEQMLEFIKTKSYKEAYDIAESLDWNKVKNASVLCAVSEVYEQNGDYQKSRDILFLAYDRAPESKKIVYRLGMLALKLGELKEAMDCYEEFIELAPKDANRFIFKYKILKARNSSVEEQIAVLEEFKKVEYVEKWAFELAGLYEQAGMITECLEECDDLILWFSEGTYIYKAMELKMQYKPLTPLQQEKYTARLEAQKEPEVQQIKEEAIPEEVVTEDVAVEEIAEEVVTEGVAVEETAEEVVVEDVATETTEEVVVEEKEDKPSLSIEEIVQNWEETQKENAQMIQAELERVEQERQEQAQNQPEEEEEKEEILSDEIRRLMEELEAESAEIDAQKSSEAEVVEIKRVEQPVVELPVQEVELPEEEDTYIEKESLEKAVHEVAEQPVKEDEGIKLGDTAQVALSTKALANSALVDVPQEETVAEVQQEPEAVASPQRPYDTGFVVQGRYDLDAQSEIGIQAGLTEEEKKIFSYFVPVHGMSEQLVKLLDDDRKCKARYGTSRIGNVVVVGRKGSGKTVLAVDIVKAIQKSRRIKGGKVAIVKAESLNKKNVVEIAGKLHGGALVIEKASRLKRHTIEDLCEVMEGQTGELLVVLEDERKPIERLFAEYPNFQKKFTSRVEVPVFINDELVTFAQTYAKENGYKIDEMGILALYSDIDILQREEKVVTVADVKALVDDAIENANRASVKKVFKKILGKNRDEADRVILKEEDFK